MKPAQEGRGRRFPRTRRIARGAEIRLLLRRGKRSKTAHLDVFDSPSPFARSRVGLVVPRHRRSAVARNRLKRRLREIARLYILPGLDDRGKERDVLVRARREAYDASFAELRDGILSWMEKREWRNSSSS